MIVVSLAVIVMTAGKQGVHDLVARTMVVPCAPFDDEEKPSGGKKWSRNETRTMREESRHSVT